MKNKWTLLVLSLVMSVFNTACDEVDSVAMQSFLLGQSSCGQYAAPIVVGPGSLNGGTALISNTINDLNITVNANTLDGWKIVDLFVYAGTGNYPAPYGYPEFSLFPVKKSFYPAGIASHSITLPLQSLTAEANSCGKSLNISVYVTVKKFDANGVVTQTGTGWAYDINYVGSTCPCKGVQFGYTVCCAPPTPSGCTLTQGYWKNHNETRKNKSQKIDWPLPMDENDKLCAAEPRTLLQLLNVAPSGGNAYLILAHQYIAASLNVAKGATTTPEVDTALSQAQAILESNCGQAVHASTSTGYSMTLLAGILDAYNKGDVGPGHCTDAAE